MTPKQYLANPMGKGAAMNSSYIKDALDREFETLKHDIMMDRFLIKGHRLIYHITIPSRSVRNLKYDVVLEFDLEQNVNEKHVENLDFLVYSNCPSFGFTYAYTFYKKKMIPQWLQNKYSGDILRNPPKIRNQYQVIFYERSLYFALKYISLKRYGVIEDSRAMATAMENTQSIYGRIKSFNDVMGVYSSAKESVKDTEEKKKKDERTKKEAAKWEPSKKRSSSAISVTSKVKNTANAKISKTKSSAKTKKI